MCACTVHYNHKKRKGNYRMSDYETEFIIVSSRENFKKELKSMEEGLDKECGYEETIDYQLIQGTKNKFYFMMMFVVNPFNDDYFEEEYSGGKALILNKMKEISEALDLESIYQDCMEDIETWEEMLILDDEVFVGMTSSIYEYIPNSEEMKNQLIKVLKDDAFIIAYISRGMLGHYD